MARDVGARELVEVEALTESDLTGFFLRPLDRPSVAKDASNHPEGAHADRRGAMNERWPVGGVVGQFQELGDLSSFGSRNATGMLK